jgi:hypothetical protein
MKIQIVKKGAARSGADAICPWLIDVPPPDSKKD